MKTFRAASVSICLLLCLPSVAAADTVLLKNGVSLTGTIETSDQKQLLLKTDYAGEIKIDWAKVAGITSDKALFVITSNGQKINGPVTPDGDGLLIQTADAHPVRVPLVEIIEIRSEQGEETYERQLHPGFAQEWKGGASLGFGLARGNSDTTNLNIGINADRKTRNDEITFHGTSVYATNNGGVAANAILANIRYDKNITPIVFAFASADYTHDALQFLQLRQIYSGGLGWHAINKPNTSFDLLAGVNYTRETYGAGTTAGGLSTGTERNLPGLTVGETFMHKFGELTVFNEDFTFYPQLNDFSQYRFAFDASATTKIHRWLGWQISVSDQYVTNPPILGTKANDVILATGLSVAFDSTPK